LPYRRAVREQTASATSVFYNRVLLQLAGDASSGVLAVGRGRARRVTPPQQTAPQVLLGDEVSLPLALHRVQGRPLRAEESSQLLVVFQPGASLDGFHPLPTELLRGDLLKLFRHLGVTSFGEGRKGVLHDHFALDHTVERCPPDGRDAPGAVERGQVMSVG